MYLSVGCDLVTSIEMYVRSCEGEGRTSSARAFSATASAVAHGVSSEMVELARKWSPTAAARLPVDAPREPDGLRMLMLTERALRAVGFQAVELDAIYQHVSEAAEQPDRRTAIAAMLAEGNAAEGNA